MGAALADQVAESLRWYKYRPVPFVKDVIGAKPDPWQIDLLDALVDHDKVQAATATGIGKDAAASWAIWWFLSTRQFAKVPCTAPNKHLLMDVLWSELHKWLRHSAEHGSILPLLFDWTATAIRSQRYPEEWFAVARTTGSHVSESGEKQAEGLAGFHADHLLFVFDEGSGVGDEHYDAAEGTLTGIDNKLLVLGNPLRLDGRFFQIGNKPSVSKYWFRFRVSALGGPQYDHLIAKSDTGKRYVGGAVPADIRTLKHRQHAQELIDEYGIDSVIVQARVFGNYPTQQTNDTGFTYDEVVQAMHRRVEVHELDEVQIGVDCARFGDDETVYIVRRGRKLRMIVERLRDSVQIAGRIAELCEEEVDLTRGYFNHRPLVCVDDAGVGGVCDLLWSQGYDNVQQVLFGSEANDSEHYANVASEMWLHDLKRLLPDLELPDDERLLHQLVSRKYEMTGKGAQRRVEPKDKMKRRGLTSPDRADALCLATKSEAIPQVIV